MATERGTISAVENGLLNPVMGMLETTDCTVMGQKSVFYIDDYNLTGVSPGQHITIHLLSSDLDTVIEIYDASNLDTRLFRNDDANEENRDSQVSFMVENNIQYVVRVSSSDEEETGEYRLSGSVFDSEAYDADNNGVLIVADGDGFQWDFFGDGAVNNGTNDAFDQDDDLDIQGGGFLRFESDEVDPDVFVEFDDLQFEENGREIVIGPLRVELEDPKDEEVLVTRKIYVPEDQGWVRYLEIITNLSGETVDFEVDIITDPGSDFDTVVVATSSGDQFFSIIDNWIITDDGQDGSQDPVLLHVIAGEGGTRPEVVAFADETFQEGALDEIVYEYGLELAPGETQIVMHFLAQNGNRETAQEKAVALANLGLDALEGLSAAEIQQVVNWVTTGLVINDVTVEEGNEGNTNAVFTVTLLSPTTEQVTLDYATADGTAEAGTDYVATSGTLTFAPEVTTQTITVEVIGDTTEELRENFLVNLSNASNTEIVRGQGTGTIATDDLIPVDLELSLLVDVSASVDNQEYQQLIEAYAAAFEGGIEGPVGVNLILWSGANQQEESVGWTVIDSLEASQAFAQQIRDTLLPPSNRPFSGGSAPGAAINFAISRFNGNGLDARRSAISLAGDGEGNSVATAAAARDNALAAGIDVINGIVIDDETRNVQEFYRSSATGGANPDGAPAVVLSANTFGDLTSVLTEQAQILASPPQISIADLSQGEGNGVTEFVFTVNLSQANDYPITVNYATADGTAIAGLDYTLTSGTLTFNPGQTSQTITVQVIGDNRVELDETFSVNLSNATNADIAADNQAIGTIENEDQIQLSNSSIDENSADGAVVGTLTATDPDDSESFTFTLEDDAEGRFDIVNNELRVESGSLLDFEAATSYDITVTATDTGGNPFEETFTITVSNVNEAPTLENIEKTALEDEDITFDVADFTSAFEDEDEDNLRSIEIEALMFGVLRLNSNVVQINDVISLNDIGNLEYTPPENATGEQIAFQITAGDGTNDSNTADVIINLTPVNDAPSFTLPGDSNQTNSAGDAVTLENFATNILLGPNNEA
ncbi:MAG: DUF1194 domain-containing protein, partial [Prochloron sp. SP5CPC1]|nr:DUF1194 domain-containing protein [Candidatus Paraprochloron terpiosi SP5CPC1]